VACSAVVSGSQLACDVPIICRPSHDLLVSATGDTNPLLQIGPLHLAAWKLSDKTGFFESVGNLLLKLGRLVSLTEKESPVGIFKICFRIFDGASPVLEIVQLDKYP
jgi:hypothetical protein